MKTFGLRHELSAIRHNTFFRSVRTLVSGTVFAHALTALTLPVLSRLYSPADFSLLAVFSSLLSILAVVACLRFDVAIPVPETDLDAVNVLGLALQWAALVWLVLTLLVLLMPGQISAWVNQPGLASYLWLLPSAVSLNASYSALQYWFVRKKQYGTIASSRILQSIASSGTQASLGLGGLAPFGLLVGNLLNSGSACLMLGCLLIKRDRSLLKEITRARMRSMFATFNRYPKYSTLEAFSNSAAIQVPIVMIAALARGPDVGYLTLAMFVMQAPMALLGSAIGQVFFSRAPDERRAGKLGDFTGEILAGLLKVGVGPILFAGIISPSIFGFVFGGDWRRAGELVAWMTPWFIMQFLVSPISTGLYVVNRHQTALGLQALIFCARVLSVYGASVLQPNYIVESYAVSGFLGYLVYFIVVVRAVNIQGSVLYRGLSSGLPYVLVFLGLGGVLAVALNLPSLAR